MLIFSLTRNARDDAVTETNTGFDILNGKDVSENLNDENMLHLIVFYKI